MELSSEIRLYFNRLWRWWISELIDLAPLQLKTMPIFQSKIATLFLCKERLRLEVNSQADDAVITKMEMSISDGWQDDLRNSILEYLKKNEVTSLKIILDTSLVFSDEFRIDNSAKYRWKKAAELEVERRSPLLKKHIITGYALSTKSDENDDAFVRWVIAHSDSLRPLLEILDESQLRSYQIFTKDTADEQIMLNVPKKPIQLAHLLKSSSLQSSLTMVLGLLILSNFLTFNHLQKQNREQLLYRVEASKDQAMQALDILNELRVLKGIRESSTEVGKLPGSGRILDELSGILPDDTWIMEFRLDGDTVQFSGFGVDPVRIAASLEESVLFSGVRVVNSSSVSEGQSQFNISLQREPEGL